MMTMEAVREWAWNAGQEPYYINSQWMLHDYDVWVSNPHYCGPEQQHPEDDTPHEEWLARQRNDYFSDGTPVAIYDDGFWPGRGGARKYVCGF